MGNTDIAKQSYNNLARKVTHVACGCPAVPVYPPPKLLQLSLGGEDWAAEQQDQQQ